LKRMCRGMHLIPKVIPRYNRTWWSRQCILIIKRRLICSRFIYPSCRTPGLHLTSRVEFFVKKGLCSMEYNISITHEMIAFHALCLSKEDHKLQLRRELILSPCRQYVYICPTTKDSHFRDVWFFACDCFKRCVPVKTLHWSPIVAMHGMFYRKLPPGLRKASFNVDYTFFIYNGMVKSFSTFIFLGGKRNTLKDFNSLCL
jgi:hypothetical protein